MCKADLIIWDEAARVHKHAFEALDRTFKDLMSNPIKIFRGKTIVLGGDFRQILPTTHEGTRKMTVDASINRSKLWRYFKIFSLHENMRIISRASSTTTEDKEIFVEWVLDLGNGNPPEIALTHLKDPTWIKIPDDYLIVPDENCVKQISSIIYSGMLDRYGDAEYLSERCILAPNNETVDEINHYIVSTYPGETHHLFRSDSITSMTGSIQREAVAYSTKFLNSLQFPGFPDHHLQLKIGVPVMLLQTINESMGLCNGTRLVVKQIGKRFIEGQIITGNRVGFHVSIPRMIFSPTGANLPFVFRRRQFPVKVCFAMTINKIQGKTLQQVGIYLTTPLFTHGQLYMAMSRTTSKEGSKILIKPIDKQPLGFTQNIVYREVFNNLHPGAIQVVDTPTRMQISETTKSNAVVLEVVETGTRIVTHLK
ncbi:uncharacterized protein LOC113311394 [Papaver somniferum]|uniref:uncharacterized protein LOC113311394 n=1 Tax=Papaver somniferum TaxID=3469 RepID=UPI000E704E8C|nr:uncharacterized protein LOC113311394 [Papaver somniferum]